MKEFVVTKRIAAATHGFQFLTSGYPNRNRRGNGFESVDGLYAEKLLQGLKKTEADYSYEEGGVPDPRQGIEVDVIVRDEPAEGFRQMWCYGFLGRSRLITPFEPKDVKRGKDCTIATIKHGSMYLSSWCEKDYFPEIPEGKVFPVWIKVQRKEVSNGNT